MKGFEAAANYVLDPKKPVIMRLDGHSFQRFTSKFQKPFDPRSALLHLFSFIVFISYFIRVSLIDCASTVHEAMLGAAVALLTPHNPSATFVFSDEISLFFPIYDQSTVGTLR